MVLDRGRGGRRGAALALLVAVCGCGERVDVPSGPLDPGGQGLVPVNGTELFVRRVGSGPPVLVVHGGPLLEHGYLLPWLEPLAAGRELVFFDQRLSGRSAGRVDSASVRVDTLVEDMEGLRERLGLERMDLLAHSWGAHLALRYALRHPDRVRSLVLVSPMAASSALWAREERALAASITLEQAEELSRLRAAPGVAEGDPVALGELLRASFRTQFHDPEAAESLSLYVPEDYGERSRQFGFLAPDLADFDLHGPLAGMERPTLLLFGADEPGAELGGRALDRALPRSRLVILEDAGHFAFIERPEAFLAEVVDFLSDPGR